MVLGAVASALYIVDAHRDIAIEAFTCLLVFKNIFSFGLTFKGLNWLIDGGVKHVFVAIGSVQVAVCCTTILMCKLLLSNLFSGRIFFPVIVCVRDLVLIGMLDIFGKKNRAFFTRHNILRLMHLE